MKIEKKVTYEERLDPGFLDHIKHASGCAEIDACIQCGTCSSSCPMSVYMDFPPRKIIAMVKNGIKDEALRNITIWLCPSCYTCQVRCPAKIKITDVMYALKRTAIEEKVYPSRFVIPILDREMSRPYLPKSACRSKSWTIGTAAARRPIFPWTNGYDLLPIRRTRPQISEVTGIRKLWNNSRKQKTAETA